MTDAEPAVKTKRSMKGILPWIWNSIVKADNWLLPLRKGIEASSIFHFLAIGTAGFTVYQLMVDLNDRADERRDRADATVERAWDRLLVPIGGNTGKGTALNTLIRNNVSFVDANFSCEKVGEWNDSEGFCVHPPIFSGLNMSEFGVDRRPLTEVQKLITPNKVTTSVPFFTNVEFQDSNFAKNIIMPDKYAGSSFSGSNLTSTEIGFVEKISISNSDLSYAEIDYRVLPFVDHSNLSNATLTNIVTLSIKDEGVRPTEPVIPTATVAVGYGNWAWADVPPAAFTANPRLGWTRTEGAPINFIGSLEQPQLYLCDPKYRAQPQPSWVRKVMDVFFSSDEGVSTEILPHRSMKLVEETPNFMKPDDSDAQQIMLRELAKPCHTLSFAEASKRWPEKYGIKP